MKYGLHLAGRAGTTHCKPDRPDRIASAVDDLMGRATHVTREYVHFLGVDPDPEVVDSLGATNELDELTMPDEWYLEDVRELDLVVSYLPPTKDVDGWLAFLDAVPGTLRADRPVPPGDLGTELPDPLDRWELAGRDGSTHPRTPPRTTRGTGACSGWILRGRARRMAGW